MRENNVLFVRGLIKFHLKFGELICEQLKSAYFSSVMHKCSHSLHLKVEASVTDTQIRFPLSNFYVI